jgi:hypothetical protein
MTMKPGLPPPKNRFRLFLCASLASSKGLRVTVVAVLAVRARLAIVLEVKSAELLSQTAAEARGSGAYRSNSPRARTCRLLSTDQAPKRARKL